MPTATLTLSPHDAALAADVESTSGLSLLEHVADAGLWRLDLARGTLHGSPRLRAWLAVAPSDPLHLDFVAEPWRDGLQARVRACACLGDPFDCHVQVITGAGLQWARILGHAVRRADGQIASVEGAVQAISPRATSSGALATVDAAGRFNYLNAQAERLLARRAARLQGRRVCSIGITVFGPKPVGVSELLKQADLAMYQAKREGRNTVCFFEAQRGVDGRQQA
jgi:hypothetical protein